MDAIKKKMQSMKVFPFHLSSINFLLVERVFLSLQSLSSKVEKDAALDRADVCEQVRGSKKKNKFLLPPKFHLHSSSSPSLFKASKAARLHADKALEEVDELVKKSQQLEVNLNKRRLCDEIFRRWSWTRRWRS